jgi:hypothetical protein
MICCINNSDLITHEITLIGVIIALCTFIIALFTYWKSVSLKRIEFIDSIYNQFEVNEIDEFYASVLENEDLEITDDNEGTLIKVLTLFDRICNYYEQKIINDKALEYIACELLDFYQHKNIRKYVDKIQNEYLKKGYSNKIIFYSGFIDLGLLLSKSYINK